MSATTELLHTRICRRDEALQEQYVDSVRQQMALDFLYRVCVRAGIDVDGHLAKIADMPIDADLRMAEAA